MAVQFLNLSPTGNEAIAVYILIDGSKHNVATVSGYMLWFTKYKTGATEYALTAVRFLNNPIALHTLINESKHNVAAIISGYMLWFTKYQTGLALNMLSWQCGSLIFLLQGMKQ